MDPAIRRDDMVGDIWFSSVLGYNNQTFPTGKQPKSWAEFWDIKKFAGPRMLADLASGAVDLEFALLADGVPKDKLYPIDVNRAFKAMDRVRPSIRKFWDTGALSAQMLADKEVVLGSIWNGRLQSVAEKGAPLAIEWNEAMLQSQYWARHEGSQEPGERAAVHRLRMPAGDPGGRCKAHPVWADQPARRSRASRPTSRHACPRARRTGRRPSSRTASGGRTIGP